MTLQVGAAQAADACRAVFSGGLQTRGSGSINFQWGSQLSGNPGNLLDTTQVRNAWGSASCGSSDCKASGWPAGDLGGIPWPKIMAQHDLHVGYLGSAEAGGAGVNHFRQIQVDGSGELVFSNSHQDYYIEQLSLAYGARVTLAPGRYWIGRLEMAGNTQLRLASGSAKVIVGSNLTLPFQASINAPEGAPGRADALQLFVRGDLQQDSSSRISGLAYVEGDYRAAFAAVLRGAVNARGVDLATAARVETDQPAINSAIWNIQCSERRDLDGDGLIDLFDPDADGDGYDDEQERLAGSDPFDAGGIPQVTPGGATGDLCVAAFAKGLQTHGKGGTIRFGWNAQLRDAPSSYLPALQVDRTLGSTARSCGSQDCQPSFSGAQAPALPAFRTSTDGFNQSVPFAGQVRLDGSRKQWGRLDLGGLSRTTLNAPGEYRLRELNLGYQAVLELAPGDYWIERLTIGSAARIQPIGNGTVRLHVRSDLELPWQAMLNATGTEQPGQASRLLVLGEGNVTLASGTTVGGFIYARGNLAQQVGALLFGGAVAANIALDSMARTHHRPDDLSRLDFGLLCDLDGDGIGDGQDDDRDGDGYSNDDEIKAGSDPDDPTSVPADLDKDGIPDALDDDRDGDGVLNVDDAFPDDPKEWKDLDGDGIGDNADPDRDGDGISNDYEVKAGTNPDDASSVPADLDKDGIPDVLDDDRDGDGVPNVQDAFPDDPKEWKDLDGDGIGDNADPDRDGDGISNEHEIQLGTNPDDATSFPPDLDKDGIPDALDIDRDGDGVPNDLDAFPDDPNEWRDLDGDGIGDNADPDRDGDGISNDYEVKAGTNPDDAASVPPDLDKDGIPDVLDDDRDGDGVLNVDDAFPDDPKEWKDLDGDGIGDNADPDRDGDGISNDDEIQLGTNPDDPRSVPADLDKDGIPDALDDDRDGDGVPNVDDAFPDDPKEWKDLDGDGIGDNADPDRDGDGISNDYELQAGTNPDDASSVPSDMDKDGIPDALDDDRDGDGVLNVDDAFPDDPKEWKDLDGDGIGDNADPDRDGDGISNDYEVKAGTNPDDASSVPPDLDKDGIPDALDDDRDGDGVANADDAFPDDPKEWKDLDGDGIGDNADPDRDGDGISNDYEVKAGTNPDDASSVPPDLDKDGIPDVLDDDRDGDGVLNVDDAFPDDPKEWKDLDGDGIGDNADPDRDGDGYANELEVQAGSDPDDPASVPADLDKDGIPDVLDDDRDGDGVPNVDDAFPDDPKEWKDLDGDGIGDNADPDRDGDGISNDYETQAGTNPDDASSVPPDLDKDGIPDVLDDDRDGDGVPNAQDAFPDDPKEWKDLDGDGIGDNADPDRDGDGISNDYEIQLGTNPDDASSVPADLDRDGIPDALDDDLDGDGVPNDQDAFPNDPKEWKDLDGDGIGDNADPDRDGDGISNDYELQAGTNPDDASSVPPDMDKDGIPDKLDDDRDGDGVLNVDDAFPDDPKEWKDLDGDGIGDNADPDRDGDGISNDYEVKAGTNPDDASSVPPDMDKDGIPDSLDDDRDGDGVANAQDAFPDDPKEWKDLDGDGIGDNADPDRDGDGVSNADEIAAGTNPDDPLDFPDRVAPEVVIDGPPVLSVNEDSVSLSGSASDAQSGVASLEFASDRFPGSRFAVTLDKGIWRASVPLLEGTNLLTLTATDKAGNGSTRILTVERLPLASDIGLTLDYPQQGATLTDARLVVRGTLRSDKAAQRLEVQVNGQPATVTPTAQATEFTFQSAPIALQQGGNTLTVQAWVDQRSLQRSLQVSYLPPQTSFKPPRFENLSPADGAQLPGSTFYLSGQLIAEAGLERVTLNGRSLTLREAGAQLLDLREALSIPNGQDSYSAELIARDKAGQESRATLRWQLDRQAPEIVLDRPLVELPARNRVSEQPFPVSGTLRERNPASFQINGNDVALQPGNAEGELRFATRLALPIGSSASLVLEASDQAGNRLRREYSLELAAQAAIGWVLPTEGTELLDLGEPINLQVAARIDDLSGQLLPRVLLQDAAGTSLAQSPLSGATTLKSATVQLPGAGQYNLVAQLLDGAGQVLAQSARAVSVIRPQQAPLALERVSPANGERNIEPNQFISLYFNQSVDVAKLQVKVYETAHGKTYADLDELGTSELQAAGYQLVDVNRDYAPVVGNLSQLPGGQIIAFYPEKDLSYDGEVSVEIRYDGEELERLRFRTRALPTLVSGVLLDQLQQPVADVEVRLAELNRSVRTNRDGGFNFGYAERAEDNIPGGAYTLQLNPGLEQRSYASDSRRVTLQQGVRNDLGRWQLTQLSAGLPFVPLRGGAQFSLLDGELKLDLGNARLFFPDGRQTGDVHAQMLQFSELPYPVEPLALPYWMYAVQPAGIRVDGQFSVDLAALKLGDGYDYLPENGSYVTLVGFDSQARRIVPVGVGLIQDLRIRSQGELALDNLDYIGFALADANLQPALKAYAAGEINLRQLQAELYRFTQAR